MRPRIRYAIIIASIAVWFLAASYGLSGLWAYGTAPGTAAHAPENFPKASAISIASDRPTLLMFIHPHCPCSRATLSELARIVTTCHDRLTVIVLMLHPANTSETWEHTDLWDSAVAIPQTRVMNDEGGVESRRFGAATSGQALLYSNEGRLLFAGGITPSRGHNGDNAGSDSIVSLVLGTHDNLPDKSSVYGCPLFSNEPGETLGGKPRCRS